jgi:hypothetical protein
MKVSIFNSFWRQQPNLFGGLQSVTGKRLRPAALRLQGSELPTAQLELDYIFRHRVV